MMNTETILIIPYRKKRGQLVAGEMCTASNEQSAERRVELMSKRFAGVAAYRAQTDEENGDLSSPQLLLKRGEIVDLDLD